MPETLPSSAPDDIRFCAQCGAPMGIREIGGKPRKACIECRYIHFVETKVGVGMMLVENGQILLVQRRMIPEKGKWCLPGGYLDYGEEPRATAAREMLEETGLIVTVDALVDVCHLPNPQGGASLFVLYRGRRVRGTLVAGGDAGDARFFSPDALPEIAFESTALAVEDLRRSNADI